MKTTDLSLLGVKARTRDKGPYKNKPYIVITNITMSDEKYVIVYDLVARYKTDYFVVYGDEKSYDGELYDGRGIQACRYTYNVPIVKDLSKTNTWLTELWDETITIEPVVCISTLNPKNITNIKHSKKEHNVQKALLNLKREYYKNKENIELYYGKNFEEVKSRFEEEKDEEEKEEDIVETKEQKLIYQYSFF